MKANRKLFILISALLTAVLVFGGCGMGNDITSSGENASSEEEKTSSEEAVSIDVTSEQPEAESGPRISCDKLEYCQNETITVSFADTDSKDWVGFYADNAEPGTVNSIVWKYAEGEGALLFAASSVGQMGDYSVFLCDNDGYEILDTVRISILGSDMKNYGAASASVYAEKNNGIISSRVEVTPSCGDKLTYRFFWAKGEQRLSGYEPIKTVTHEGSEGFTVQFNDCMYMPENADSVEISVREGHSVSVFAASPDSLRLPESNRVCEFNVITDLHVASSFAPSTRHLLLALDDIKELSPDSIGIFTCGDNTDRGTEENYKLLLDTLEKGSVGSLPAIHFALGNHDIVYGSDYGEQLALFEKYTGAPGAYYSVAVDGKKFIFLGSDTKSSTGTVGSEQLSWLESELASVGKDTPVFLFLHQPLIETVSGSLYSLDHEIQDWYGITSTGSRIREILSQYPNAFLFTGHTHWQFSSIQPLLAGRGSDANFVNCASVGYLWTDDDASTGGSQGMFVEVYEDYVLLRGREFVNGTWCACAQFMIPIY